MQAFIIRNILQRLLLVFIVSILAHSVIHLAPGEPSEVDPTNPRMKPEDIAKIRNAVDEMEYSYKKQDVDGMVKADVELHQAILLATGNDILVTLVDNISELLSEMRHASLSISEGVEETIAGHRAILDALERKDSEDAKEAMRKHLKMVSAKIASTV